MNALLDAYDLKVQELADLYKRLNAPITYPENIEAGVRVDKLGNSSVQYGIAIFREGEDEAAAHGHFVHVFVERAANKSVPIPGALRAALERLL